MGDSPHWFSYLRYGGRRGSQRKSQNPMGSPLALRLLCVCFTSSLKSSPGRGSASALCLSVCRATPLPVTPRSQRPPLHRAECQARSAACVCSSEWVPRRVPSMRHCQRKTQSAPSLIVALAQRKASPPHCVAAASGTALFSIPERRNKLWTHRRRDSSEEEQRPQITRLLN